MGPRANPSLASSQPAVGPKATNSTERIEVSTPRPWVDLGRRSNRIESLGVAPAETRRYLRASFSRWLSDTTKFEHRSPNARYVDDGTLLDFCISYRLAYRGDSPNLELAWDEERSPTLGDPTFAELVAEGWLATVDGRWRPTRSPTGLPVRERHPSEHAREFLYNLFDPQVLELQGQATSSQVRALAKEVQSGAVSLPQLTSPNPQWVAAKLWEVLCPEQASESAVDVAFREWSDWCSELHLPFPVGHLAWSQAHDDLCRGAALRILVGKTSWLEWSEEVQQYLSLLETWQVSPAQAQARMPVLPLTLVARLEWLSNQAIEQMTMDRLLERSLTRSAFRFLWHQVEVSEGSRSTSLAAILLENATKRPVAMQGLCSLAQAHPQVLADILLFPATAAASARLILEWQFPGSAWNRSTTEARNEQAKSFAVEDAVSVLTHGVETGTLPMDELASLVAFCYSDAPFGHGTNVGANRRIGRGLMALVSARPAETQAAFLASLVAQALSKPSLSGEFWATLDSLDLLAGTDVSVAAPLVGFYTAQVKTCALRTSDASNLTPKLAAALASLAMSLDEPARDEFLTPLNVVAQLREAPQEKVASTRAVLAGTLRAHIRVLARATIGWTAGAVPQVLATALQQLVERACVERDEKGQVGALTARYQSMFAWEREDRSPAEDLAAACGRLGALQAKTLLDSVLDSDDPVLLATLAANLSGAAKRLIVERLRRLTPARASSAWTWTELDRRADALIGAGEFELARQHLDIGKSAEQTAPQSTLLSRFHAELRLLFAAKAWEELGRASAPERLNGPNAQQAQDYLDFYQATSQLFRPNGDLERAQATLRRLCLAQPDVGAYVVNLYAVRIRLLVGPFFRQLVGPVKRNGELLLVELEQGLEALQTLSDRDRSDLSANRAYVLLALGRADDALASLATLRNSRPSAYLEIYAALAHQILGQLDSAIAILDAAIDQFGPDAVLVSMKEELRAHRKVSSAGLTNVSVDPATNVRHALQALRSLTPSQQGEVLAPLGLGLREFLALQVARAVAALQHMAPVLRHRTDQSNDAKLEDDLTTAVREVLNAGLAQVGWTASDQSLGGFTQRANPGERDIVVSASGHELAIYESIVCDRLDRKGIVTHFHKLLAYGSCDVRFYVIYSYAKQAADLLAFVCSMAKEQPPSGHEFREIALVGPPDYEVHGYLARYAVDHREVSVIFFLVDLAQVGMRAAIGAPAVHPPGSADAGAD